MSLFDMNGILSAVLPARLAGGAGPGVRHKRRHQGVDTRMRFTLEPLPGDDAFQQWRDAMKAVARLPCGIPPEFRRKVWLSLADQYIAHISLDWEKTRKFAFNEKTNPDDNTLGMQIVKDLHRTGCSGFSGQDNEEERAMLKRVLLAYARWNKRVGYCQGFNVIAALVLHVMDHREDDALKVMMLLIDHVLPESYFANNLRALSVDMAVFRDLLRAHLPRLSRYLDHLQHAAADINTGANYEPPLTNVFTMQWFLTLFATCLPQNTALRVWDSVLLEGSEILLRTALAIWAKLQNRILAIGSADEFYSTMGVLTQEMLDDGIIDPDELMKTVYNIGPFPFPQLAELREKYTYNITPFTAAVSGAGAPTKQGKVMNIFSDDDEIDEDELMDNINCFTGIFPQQVSPSKQRALKDTDRSQSASAIDISKVGPGAYAANPEQLPDSTAYMERMTMDIDMLKNQYKRLRTRQKQAHIILAAANAKHQARTAKPTPVPLEPTVAVNHLFLGRRSQSSKRNKTVMEAAYITPSILKSRPVSCTGTMVAAPAPASSASSQCTDVPESPASSVCGGSDDAVESDTNTQCPSLGSDTPQDTPRVSISDTDRPSVSPTRSVESAAVEPLSCDQDLQCMDESRETCTERQKDSYPQDSVDRNTDTSLSPQPSSDVVVTDSGVVKISGPEPSMESTECSQANDHLPVNDSTSVELDPEHQSVSVSENYQKPTLLQIAKNKDVVERPASIEIPSGSCEPNNNGRTETYKNTTQASKSKIYKIEHTINITDTSPDSPVKTTTATSPSHSKVFNPFPSTHISQRKARNGLKLGLYSAESLAKLEKESGKKGVSPVGHIGRAQLNACLHRQYMTEIRQQAKSGKR